jgi:hypothetical protein
MASFDFVDSKVSQREEKSGEDYQPLRRRPVDVAELYKLLEAALNENVEIIMIPPVAVTSPVTRQRALKRDIAGNLKPRE